MNVVLLSDLALLRFLLLASGKTFTGLKKKPKTITEFGEKAEQYINMHTRNRVNVRNHAETRNMRMCLAAFHSESLEKGVCVIE